MMHISIKACDVECHAALLIFAHIHPRGTCKTWIPLGLKKWALRGLKRGAVDDAGNSGV